MRHLFAGLNWIALYRPYDLWAIGAAGVWSLSWFRPGADFHSVHGGLEALTPSTTFWGLYFAGICLLHVAGLRWERLRAPALFLAAVTWWGVFGSFVVGGSVTGWGMYLLHALGCSYAWGHAKR